MTEKTINRNKQREMQTFPCLFVFIQALLNNFNSLSLFPQELQPGEVNRVKSLQAVEKRPSAALSGRLTISAAWQKVAPYSSRRHPSSFPVSSTGRACSGVSVGAIHELPLQSASACLREAPPCGAKAGAFLISLKKEFFNRLLILDFREWSAGEKRAKIPLKENPDACSIPFETNCHDGWEIRNSPKNA
jgi:hypothetical protein